MSLERAREPFSLSTQTHTERKFHFLEMPWLSPPRYLQWSVQQVSVRKVVLGGWPLLMPL